MTELIVPPSDVWTLDQTLTLSGVTTISSSTFAAHDLWKMLLEIYVTSSGGTGSQPVYMTFNGDSGANYAVLYMNGTTPTNSTGLANLLLGDVYDGVGQSMPLTGEITFGGKSYAANANDYIFVAFSLSSYGMTPLSGYYKCGVNDITSLTLFNIASLSMYGKVSLFYRDF